MYKWEERLNEVDNVLYKWMRKQKKSGTDPVNCIGVLEEAGIYKPTDRSGFPLRNDLRDARKVSGVSALELFVFETAHLQFEQEAKFQPWRIFRK